MKEPDDLIPRIVVLELSVKSHLLKINHQELLIKSYLSRNIYQKFFIKNHLSRIIN